MALVISTATRTGTGVAYTVPTGKVAKVRLVSISGFRSGFTISIGNYVSLNTTGGSVDTKHQGKDGNVNSNVFGLPVSGFVRACNDGYFMGFQFLYLKEDYVLVAGETATTNDNNLVISYTIFEEDA